LVARDVNEALPCQAMPGVRSNFDALGRDLHRHDRGNRDLLIGGAGRAIHPKRGASAANISIGTPIRLVGEPVGFSLERVISIWPGGRKMPHSSSGMTSGPYRYLAALRAGGFPIRAYFSVGVIIILIPALLLSGWLASLSAASKREQIEQSIQQKVREITIVIDREVVSTMNMLTALASSHFVHVGDFESFQRQAEEISRQLNIHIVLRDLHRDRHLVNTAAPWGAPLPRGPPPAAALPPAQQPPP